ncbi:hypothetical protein QJS66_03065 [Kocuria rhizophila]|nr:hypothetical protein QJS66_03065 [Kocuria rhizophila]
MIRAEPGDRDRPDRRRRSRLHDGQLDDEHLDHPMSRSRRTQARRLVVRGFLFEIIQQVGVEALEEQLRASLEDQLARTES